MHFLLLVSLLAFENPTNWWTNYKDPELNRLVTTALENNLDLRIATQRIAEARAITGETRSRLGPSVNLTGSVNRLRGGFAQNIIRIPNPSGAQQSGSFVSPFETGLLQGGLDMKWELDFFGTNRAALAAARADVQTEEELRQDLSITVSAEVARYYFDLRGAQNRLSILERNLATQRDLLALLRDRRDAGLSSQLDVEQQEVLIANTEASMPPLQAQTRLAMNRLATLLGNEAVSRGQLDLSAPLPDTPAVSAEISSELLKRRPDVRAAESRMAASLARLKQSRTDLYPKINLNGLVGRQGTSFTGLSLGGGNFFNIGPQLQLPLFNSGRIKSNIRASEARLEQERLNYQREILTAFEEAANAISNLTRQREREQRLASASSAASRSLALAQDLAQAGLNDFITVLDAQRNVLEADFNRATAQTEVLLESVALYKALAGGWPN
jgi:NodT family efflux transporter outer membrane factor (OMF) lipoprotein